MAPHLHARKARGADRRSGPDAAGRVRQGRLLDLVDHLVENGEPTRAAAELLGLDEVRGGRWQVRHAG